MILPFRLKRLILDLHRKRSQIETIEDDVLEYGGGKGLNLQYFKKKGLDEDIVLIATGLFSSSGFPCASFSYMSKLHKTLKYPVTSGFGGGFGLAMRMAGFHQIVLKGASKTPAILFVDDEEVRFADASSFAEKTALSTDMHIHEKYNDVEIETLSVGNPPKELLDHAVLFSSGTWPVYRFGFGKDFVERGVKALAIRGGGGTVIHDKDRYLGFISRLFEKIAANEQLSSSGRGWNLIQTQEDWQPKFFEAGREACYGCPVGCARLMPIEGGDFMGRALAEEMLFLSLNMAEKKRDRLLMEAYRMRSECIDPFILFTDDRDKVERLHGLGLEEKVSGPGFKGVPFPFDPHVNTSRSLYYDLTCQDYDYFKFAADMNSPYLNDLRKNDEAQSLKNMIIAKMISDMVGVCPLVTSRVSVITTADIEEGFEILFERSEQLGKLARKLIDVEREMSRFTKDDDLVDPSWDERLSIFYEAIDWDDRGRPGG